MQATSTDTVSLATGYGPPCPQRILRVPRSTLHLNLETNCCLSQLTLPITLQSSARMASILVWDAAKSARDFCSSATSCFN
eukprot:5765350-Amphidinium_carterae.1